MVKKPMVEDTFTTVAVRVIPRAKENGIKQVLEDGTIKIRVKAPPVNGKANQSLIKLFADVFEINSSQIEIISGRNRREKLVRITGLAPEYVKFRIEEELA